MLPLALVHARTGTLSLRNFLLALMVLAHIGVAVAQQPRQTPPAALPQLSDGLAWKQPMYHCTIQAVDIDGDGQSEILARWIDGLHVYRFENGTLLRHSRIPALSDNEGFHESSWHSTIRTGVLDRTLRQADVIARKQDGIHVFRYDSVRKQW